MADKSLAQIRQELSQIRQDLAGEVKPAVLNTGGIPDHAKKYPLFDLGLFLLANMFWLIIVSNILLACGVAVSQINCLAAVVLSWITLWLMRRNSFLYSLLISLLGALVLFVCVYLIGGILDLSWDGNWYHKVDTGLLAHGWNPFRLSMGDYAYQSGIIPVQLSWPAWYDGYPKSTYTIGACFYSLLGTIEAGKSYNVVAVISLLCMSTSLLQRVGKLKFYQAFLIALFLAFNPVSLAQSFTYYNDGFIFSMLSIYMISLCSLFLDEGGELSSHCWAAVFMSLCIGLNIKFSGLISFGILGMLFYVGWIIIKFPNRNSPQVKAFFIRVTLFFIAAVLCALLLSGATTYIVNTLRYQNPLYSIVGQGATPFLVEQQTPSFLRGLPKIERFFYSIFARMTNDIYELPGNYLKLPFTIAADEWNYAVSVDIRTSGWGIFFSGVFILSVAVVLSWFIAGMKNHPPKAVFCLILLILAYIFIPPIFVEGYWWARYYIQLLWLPALALVILLSAFNKYRAAKARGKSFALACITGILIGAMLFNMIPSALYIKDQVQSSAFVKETLAQLKLQRKVFGYQLKFGSTQFYGILFNVIDEDIDFSFAREDTVREIAFSQPLYSFLLFEAYKNDQGKSADAQAFFSSLRDHMNDCCILIAASDDASQGFDETIIQAMHDLGLSFPLQGKSQYSYLAVINGGTVQYEKIGTDEMNHTFTLADWPVELISTGIGSDGNTQIIINSFDYSLHGRGLNIVVYDNVNHDIADAVNIDTGSPGHELSR